MEILLLIIMITWIWKMFSCDEPLVEQRTLSAAVEIRLELLPVCRLIYIRTRTVAARAGAAHAHKRVTVRLRATFTHTSSRRTNFVTGHHPPRRHTTAGQRYFVFRLFVLPSSDRQQRRAVRHFWFLLRRQLWKSTTTGKYFASFLTIYPSQLVAVYISCIFFTKKRRIWYDFGVGYARDAHCLFGYITLPIIIITIIKISSSRCRSFTTS